jgi:hypothetical protein
MSKENMQLKASLVFWLKNTEDGFTEEESYRELINLIEKRKNTLKRRPTEIKFGSKDLADHYTCFYCGLAHKKVEAGGMWWCPNVTCAGPGNSYFRTKLKSYKETGSQHTVDTKEWSDKATEELETATDADLIDAIKAGIKKMEVSLASSKFGL